MLRLPPRKQEIWGRKRDGEMDVAIGAEWMLNVVQTERCMHMLLATYLCLSLEQEEKKKMGKLLN